jgi:hypothetical protein
MQKSKARLDKMEIDRRAVMRPPVPEILDLTWELTSGRMDLTLLLFEGAVVVAVNQGSPQLCLDHFAAAVDACPALNSGLTRNPFRLH